MAVERMVDEKQQATQEAGERQDGRDVAPIPSLTFSARVERILRAQPMNPFVRLEFTTLPSRPASPQGLRPIHDN